MNRPVRDMDELQHPRLGGGKRHLISGFMARVGSSGVDFVDVGAEPARNDSYAICYDPAGSRGERDGSGPASGAGPWRQCAW